MSDSTYPPVGHTEHEPFDDSDPDAWHDRNLARIRANSAARKARADSP